MQDNLIAYMTWDRLVAWKILSLEISGGERLVPIAYGSKQKIFSKYATPGNTIWVFSMPNVKIFGSPVSYKYKPTLVARITIKELIHKKTIGDDDIALRGVKKLLSYWEHVAVSDPDKSEFYELNDATELLFSLEFQSNHGKSKLKNPLSKIPSNDDIAGTQLIRSKIGQQLESIRRLSHEKDIYLKSLEDHAEQVSKRKVFISYAHGDGKQFPLELADAFLERNWSPWVDALTIPPKKKKQVKSARIPPGRLFSLLRYGIQGSALFVGLVTDNYVRKEKETDVRWTLKEWDIARESKRAPGGLSIVQISENVLELQGAEKVFSKRQADLLASSITNWYNYTFKKITVDKKLEPN